MSTRVAYMGRHEFVRTIKTYEENFDDRYAVISISDNETERLEIKTQVELHTNCNNGIFVAFADSDDTDCINNKQAKEIVQFIADNEGKFFIVHCFAGVSRSAAVAKFINEYYDLGLVDLENYKIYNKKVKNRLDAFCHRMSMADYYAELELNERVHDYESKDAN